MGWPSDFIYFQLIDTRERGRMLGDRATIAIHLLWTKSMSGCVYVQYKGVKCTTLCLLSCKSAKMLFTYTKVWDAQIGNLTYMRKYMYTLNSVQGICIKTIIQKSVFYPQRLYTVSVERTQRRTDRYMCMKIHTRLYGNQIYKDTVF
jgi:hypothetical protein